MKQQRLCCQLAQVTKYVSTAHPDPLAWIWLTADGGERGVISPFPAHLIRLHSKHSPITMATRSDT